jgi:hypothetical protein
MESPFPSDHQDWNDKNTIQNQISENELITTEAKKYDGMYGGFQPKPVVELIIVARKPLSEDSIRDQVLSNGKGGTYLDRCRIPAEYDELLKNAQKGNCTPGDSGVYSWNTQTEDKINKMVRKIVGGRLSNPITFGQTEQTGFKIRIPKQQGSPPQCDPNNSHNSGYNTHTINYTDVDLRGRVPGNLLVSDNVLDLGTKTKSSGGLVKGNFPLGTNVKELGSGGYTDKNFQSDVSGGYGDVSDFSDKFSLDKWFAGQIKNLPKELQNTFPFIMVPKPTKAEKNRGLEDFDIEDTDDGCERTNEETGREYGANKKGRKNKHITVKPIKLIEFLIALSPTKPGDIILDSFCGSGTTAIACKLADRKYICIERDQESYQTAVDHIKAFKTQKSIFSFM